MRIWYLIFFLAWVVVCILVPCLGVRKTREEVTGYFPMGVVYKVDHEFFFSPINSEVPIRHCKNSEQNLKDPVVKF